MTKLFFQQNIYRFDKGCFFVGGILLLFCCPGSAQSEPPSIDDIRDIMVDPPPASVFDLVVWIVVIVAVLLVGLLALRKFLRRKPETKGPPPELIARQRLGIISQQVDDMPPNKASLETSEAVKDFLTAQYGDPIRFETAEEYLTRMIDAMKGGTSKIPPALTEEVRTFMSISQELKFAQIKEARGRIPALIEKAEKIIGISVQHRMPPGRGIKPNQP